MILTDLPPEASTACWYGLRAWIEQGFKITKRAGWQWQRTQMTKPERAARLWLAVAVATLWLLSVGGEAEETIPASTVPDVTALIPKQPRMRRATRLRLVSVFRRGWNLILVALLDQAPLPQGRFRGIAVAFSYGSYASEVAEISIEKDGKVRVHRVVCAIDCGTGRAGSSRPGKCKGVCRKKPCQCSDSGCVVRFRVPNCRAG